MSDQPLLHTWCSHCGQSLCGLSTDTDDVPDLDAQVGAEDEGRDCIVCADLGWSSQRKARCLRVSA